ncbi:O-antigen ligase family protein [Flavobacteriaceae bacterium]|nr:O-antigen ligase family protein [Flavobacteriaceae bacterium]
MKYFLLLLFLITGFIYDTQVIDVIGPQWLYLGGINLITALYNLYKKNFDTLFSKEFKRIIIVYLLLTFTSLFSIVFATNWTLSVVDIIRQIIFFTTFLNVYSLFNKNKIDKAFYVKLSRVFLLVFLIEISDILVAYLMNFDTARPRQFIFSGFSTNVNIASISMMIKIPLLMYLMLYDKWVIKLLSIVSFILFSYFLFWTQSRAVFLTLGLSMLFLSLIALKRKSKPLIKIISFVIIVFVVNGFLSTLHIKSNTPIENNESTITTRINSLTEQDTSVNLRLMYWKGGLKQISKSPIIGVGVGNWKLNSLEYDSTYMNNYQVQYHMHNDFLQVFAELGIIGFLLFCYFIFLIGWRLLKYSFNKSHLFYSLLFISFIAYFVDLSFNFPHERSEIQSIFASIIALVFLLKKNDEKRV